MEKIKVNLIPGTFILCAPEVENSEYLILSKKEVNMYKDDVKVGTKIRIMDGSSQDYDKVHIIDYIIVDIFNGLLDNEVDIYAKVVINSFYYKGLYFKRHELELDCNEDEYLEQVNCSHWTIIDEDENEVIKEDIEHYKLITELTNLYYKGKFSWE